MEIPKATSFQYGTPYQRHQAESYRNRHKNHWKHRIEVARTLMNEFALKRLGGKAPGEAVVVDIGCSIGTFAIEFAKQGYRSYGVDFDPSALDIARQLAHEEGVSPEFVCGDVSDWSTAFPAIDIAVCFDVFEHLHDDELGALLVAVRKQLSASGTLLFHTFPCQYDYLFHSRAPLRWPLLPFARLSTNRFATVVKMYASVLDIGLLLATGKTYKERIKHESHCNPTTVERLTDILTRTGYEILSLESSDLFASSQGRRERFAKQTLASRNIYGAAIPRSRA